MADGSAFPLVQAPMRGVRRRKVLVADLLCGAGGSTEGAEQALNELGLEMELVCVNHWAPAIETHRRNHPKARHYVQDIATVRPHLIVPEGYLDLLMASPTCTHHSVARGGKPTSDQQRSDPWHIITWLTELRVKRIIIENVWEFIGWGPVDPKTGRPIPERKGEYFNAWIETLRRLGFEPEWRKLNAADYGDATTRKRFILMARSDRRRVLWPVATHARNPEPGSGLLSWRPARDIINWNRKGRSIFTRDKDLAPKTLLRVLAGAEKHDWPNPFIVILRNHMAARGIELPLPTITAGGGHIGLAEPVLLNLKKRSVALSADAPLPTLATHASVASAEPVIVRTGMHGANGPGLSSDGDPLPTITTDGGLGLAQPIVLAASSSAARSADEPLPTGGAGTAGHPGCARPMLAEPVIFNGRRNNQAEPVSTSPLPTLDTKGGVWLAEPFVLSQGAGGAPRAVDAPLPTIPGGGAHALISPYYSDGGGVQPCYSDEEPLPTITAKDRLALVVPVTHSAGGPRVRDAGEPLATMTTAKGGEFAIVMPVTHHDGSDRVRDAGTEPLPTITGAQRGELAFITAQHGERPGQAPRTHDLDAPLPTVAATGHVDLVEGVDLGGYDILFRMLDPDELGPAMGFDDYEFVGTKTQQIKQIGNAVSVRKMKACVTTLMADAVPRRRAASSRTAAA